VQNSAALNSAVKAYNSDVGRVVGYHYSYGPSDGLDNNYAFSGLLNRSGTAFWHNIGIANRDGENISGPEIYRDGAINGLFENEPWKKANGKLPGFASPVNMPLHIENIEPVITGIEISPVEITLLQGQTVNFNATVLGTNGPSQEVEWTLTGAGKVETGIEDGVLTIAADETATTLTVTVKAKDTEFSAAATVTIVPGITGDGGETTPYIITTAEHLMMIAKNVNEGQGNYAYAYYKLGNDIDLSGYNWTPIGNGNYEFGGNFDGNGKVISGLNVNGSSDYVGLFGYIYDGSVKNLGLQDVNVNGNYYVGGIAGVVYYGSITNCYTTGTVSGSQQVGGIAGYVEYGGRIENCYSTAEVRGNSGVGGIAGYNYGTVTNCVALNSNVSYNNSQWGNLGRVVGSNSNSLSNNYGFSGMLTNSYNGWYNKGINSRDGADITAEQINGDGTLGDIFADEEIWTTANGKLPGFGEAIPMPEHLSTEVTVTSIVILPTVVTMTAGSTRVFSATVNGKNNPSQSVEWTITGKKSAETVISNDGTLTIAAGETAEMLTIKATSTVEGFTNVSSNPVLVTIVPAMAGDGTESTPYIITSPAQLLMIANNVNNNVSGFASAYYKLGNDIDLSGYNWIPIGNNYSFSGNFDGNSKVISGLNINSNGESIGLFGYIYNGSVKNLGLQDVNVNGNYYVGGIAGYVEYGSITNCYTTGTVRGSELVGGIAGIAGYGSRIENCYSTAEVRGNYGVGGIAGYNEDGIVRNCVALNSNVSYYSYYDGNFGRVVGYSYGSLSNNYGLSDMPTNSGGWNNYIGVNYRNGGNITAGEIWSDGTLNGIFADAEIWTTEDGSLPGFGEVVAMPAHIVKPIIISVAILPSGDVYIQKGDYQRFEAVVETEGSASDEVEWEIVEDIESEDTDFYANGLLYVASDIAVESFTIKATSKVDNTKFATATVYVTDAPVAPTIIGEAEIEIEEGYKNVCTDAYKFTGTQPMQISIAPENAIKENVSWNENNKRLCFNGKFEEGEYKVTISARNIADTENLEFTLKVTEVPLAVAYINITGSNSVVKGKTQRFEAEVIPNKGTEIDQSVTWGVYSYCGNNNPGTQISEDGILTVAANESCSELTVYAISVFDPDQYDEIWVSVQNPPPSVVIAPEEVSMLRGKTQTFTATLFSLSGGILWYVEGNESEGTAITQGGTLTVATGETADELTVYAYSTSNPAIFGTATVNIVEVANLPKPTISGGQEAMELLVGYSATSTAAYIITGADGVSLNGDSKITWSNNKLNIAAGLAVETYEVTITATNDAGSTSKTFTLTVKPVPTVTEVIISSANTTVIKGGTLALSASVIGENAPPQGVTWRIIGSNGCSEIYNNTLRVENCETATTLTIIATSAYASVSGVIMISVVGAPVAPTIAGAEELLLLAGYAATSTTAYTITGTGNVVVSKVSGDEKITWNNEGKKLNIAAGLGAGTYPVVLKASNGVDPDAEITFTLTVSTPITAPVIAAGTLPDVEVDSAYSATLSATTGGAAITWSAEGLPAGLTINPETGVISGTPTTAGSYSFVVKASNSAGEGIRVFSINVEGEPTVIASIPKANALKVWMNSGMLHINGLTAGKSWSVYSANGALLHSGVANGADVNVNLNLASGIYFVKSNGQTIRFANK